MDPKRTHLYTHTHKHTIDLVCDVVLRLGLTDGNTSNTKLQMPSSLSPPRGRCLQQRKRKEVKARNTFFYQSPLIKPTEITNAWHQLNLSAYKHTRSQGVLYLREVHNYRIKRTKKSIKGYIFWKR